MPTLAKSARLFADLVFIGGGLLCLAVLGFVLLHHDRLLTSPMRAAFFLGLPVAGGAACVVGMRLAPALRVSLAVSLFAAVFALYAFEVLMTFRPRAVDAAPTADFDPRTKYEVVRDLRRQGVMAYPSVFPQYLMQTSLKGTLHSPLRLDGAEFLPLSGIPGVRTVLCNESGAYVLFDADELGFANPRGLWPGEGGVDIAAVGDSFTQGYCVQPEASFIGLIRGRHPKTLSLGMSGNGPLLELAGLKEFLPERRPRIVLWFFYEGNDIPGDLDIERRSPLLMRYLEPGFRQAGRPAEAGGLLVRHVEDLIASGDGRRETDAGIVQTLTSITGLSRVRSLLRLPSTSADRPDYALFRAILAEADRTVKAWNGCLAFVYLPQRDTGATSELVSLHDGVRRVVEGLGLPFIDGVRALRAHPDPLTLFPRGRHNHYNEAGHRLMAETVLNALESGMCR
ncbi:MAG: SGNH/GDSL hydrolase family protein [Alphaproteobacteria bacterium]|nr:SGNH/GDSL hydrolase family protein [Alphaproteobacteria bacterium]